MPNEELEHAIRDWIVEEVARQCKPLQEKLDAVMHLNEEQSRWLQSFDAWRKALFGNGSGQPGFLEEKRAEDRRQFGELLAVVTKLRETVLRDEGKEALRKEQVAEMASALQNADSARTNRWSRWQTWIVIGFTILGAVWFLPLIRALFRYLGRL